jgi:hypothetical protein
MRASIVDSNKKRPSLFGLAQTRISTKIEKIISAQGYKARSKTGKTKKPPNPEAFSCI